MAGDTTLTITGNLTADPELRFTATGTAVAAFTVAASRRVYDQASGQWQDGDTLFLRCSAWRDLADHATASLFMRSSDVDHAFELVFCGGDTSMTGVPRQLGSRARGAVGAR